MRILEPKCSWEQHLIQIANKVSYCKPTVLPMAAVIYLPQISKLRVFVLCPKKY